MIQVKLLFIFTPRFLQNNMLTSISKETFADAIVIQYM